MESEREGMHMSVCVSEAPRGGVCVFGVMVQKGAGPQAEEERDGIGWALAGNIP